MRKLVLFFMALCMGVCSVMAQQDKPSEKVAKKAQKEAQKGAKRVAKKAENEARIKDALTTSPGVFKEALQALIARQFVLEADRVEFKRGRFKNVSSSTNFVLMEGDKASIQLAFNGILAGPNGVGGVTVDGSAFKVELNVDKKGNVSYEMSVQGFGVSAKLYIRMSKESNHCTATVSPNFNSNRISFTGLLLPLNKSTVFKGRAL